MFFDPKIITVLLFIIINFTVLFFVKTNINKAISLIFSYLVTVLFLAMNVSSYDNLKEIIVLSAAYLSVVLFLVFNCDSLILEETKKSKIKKIQHVFFIVPALVFTVLIIFFSTFWITKNIPKISSFVEEKKIEIKNKELFGSLKNPSDEITIDEAKGIAPRPIAVVDNQPYKTQDEFNMNMRRRARLKDQLSDSFLLKRSSDLILFIMVLSVFPLLILRKKEI